MWEWTDLQCVLSIDIELKLIYSITSSAACSSRQNLNSMASFTSWSSVLVNHAWVVHCGYRGTFLGRWVTWQSHDRSTYWPRIMPSTPIYTCLGVPHACRGSSRCHGHLWNWLGLPDSQKYSFPTMFVGATQPGEAAQGQFPPSTQWPILENPSYCKCLN